MSRPELLPLISRPWIATYRVQFGPEFSFADAADLAPYFAEIGISHLYASPIGLARSGSTHGYDVCDPTIIDPALGGEAGFRRLADALARYDIGILLDIVPNHMATDATNPFWMDALEFGAAGPAGGVFDIDWSRPVSLPWLSEDADGPAALTFDAVNGRFLLGVGGGTAPLRPRSVGTLLEQAGSPAATRWHDLETASTDPSAIAQARLTLREWAAVNPSAVEHLVASADVATLAADQHWRGIPWRAASTDLTYRRFFAVSELIGVRVEEPAIFDLVHGLPLRLLQERLIDGLRIDHIDGLADPEAYCRRLRQAVGPDTLIVLEKILGAGELLRHWPVEGTTGYEHLDAINQLFVPPAGRKRLRNAFFAIAGADGTAQERAEAAKEEMLRGSFQGEIGRLVGLASSQAPELPPDILREACIAFIRSFSVYRSYASERDIAPADLALWEDAAARAITTSEPEIGIAVKRLVDLLRKGEGRDAEELRRRLQQLTGPAMAKGVEDTELYRDVSVSSANEVGVDLGALFRSKAEFTQLFLPGDRKGLVPLATHDTKRGADTRARINALAEDPEAFIAFFQHWSERLQPVRAALGGPHPADEWLIFQTLIGAWPISLERLGDYLVKALREARLRSTWDNPDGAYEEAVVAYIRALLLSPDMPFQHSLLTFVEPVIAAGRRNGIAQMLLQLTLPGTPDLYQGTELWEHSLVDPDNRRPVDFDLRRNLVARADHERPTLEDDANGIAKLRVLKLLLRLRRQFLSVFEGGFELLLYGPAWLALHRFDDNHEIVVVVPLRGMAGGDPPPLVSTNFDGSWTDVLSAASVRVEAGSLPVDAAFPFRVLLRSRTSEGTGAWSRSLQ